MSWVALAISTVVLGVAVRGLVVARRTARALQGRFESVRITVGGAGGNAAIGRSGTAVGGPGGSNVIRRSDGTVEILGGAAE